MKSFYYLIIVLILSSCSLFRNVNRSKVKTKVVTETTTNEKTFTVEKERRIIDTTVNITGSTISKEKPVQNLLDGDSLISENNHVRGSVTYDKITGKLKLTTTQKPQDLPVKMSIEKVRTIESNSNTVTKKEVKTMDKVVNKKVVNWGWLWWLLIIPVVIAVYYFVRKKFSWFG